MMFLICIVYVLCYFGGCRLLIVVARFYNTDERIQIKSQSFFLFVDYFELFE